MFMTGGRENIGVWAAHKFRMNIEQDSIFVLGQLTRINQYFENLMYGSGTKSYFR